MTSYPGAEGELLFLTDSAYLSLIDDRQATRPTSSKQKHDGLFLERLDSFIEGQIRDMAAFADREQHSLDEIRKLVAIPHAKFLFSSQNEAANGCSSTPSVRGALARLSSTLQTLHSTAGLDSLLLVVAPAPPPGTSSTTPPEASWIGGTELGKDFWMGLKGGGVAGVRTFRAKCRAAEASIPTPAHARSGDIKTELNAAVRHALRTASGNPSAEMRWTRPAALEDAYGVRMRGWPAGILRRNPSNNTVRENRQLLECIRSGGMRFVPRGSMEWDEAALELENGSMVGESRTADEARGDDYLQVSTLPGAAAHPPPMNSSPIPTSSHLAVPSPSHNGAALPPPAHAAKRSAGSDHPQDRRTRRRTDADTG